MKEITKVSCGLLFAGALLASALIPAGRIRSVSAEVKADDNARFIHTYRHSEKYRHNAYGYTVNETAFTDNDATTYPFLYQSYTSSGEGWGMPGSQKAPITMMSYYRTDSWAKGCIYEDGTFSGYNSTGGIASISSWAGNESGIVLTFVAPHAGEVRISDFVMEYCLWGYPNGANFIVDNGQNIATPYSVNGIDYRATYDGLRFKVTVNGQQAYPLDKEWDTTAFTEKYEEDTEDTYLNAKFMLSKGDLKLHQAFDGDIKGMYVKQYDEVNLIFSHNDPNSDNYSVNHNADFDVTFSIDPTARLDDYVYAYSTFNRFDGNKENLSSATVSYWYYDVSRGLYGNDAVRKLMPLIDYANGSYTTALFGTAVSANYNSLNCAAGQDAALVYQAPETGNLLIKAENLYRGADMALWEYFDNYQMETDEVLAKCDGVRMRVELNGERVWPLDQSWETYQPTMRNQGKFDWEELTLGVKAGDSVCIRVNCGSKGWDTYDKFNFSPMFVLTPTASPVQNRKITVADGADEKGKGATLAIAIAVPVTAAVAAAAVTTTVVLLKRKKKN